MFWVQKSVSDITASAEKIKAKGEFHSNLVNNGLIQT